MRRTPPTHTERSVASLCASSHGTRAALHPLASPVQNASFVPTPQQDAVNRAIALTRDHILVQARAGTGKTSATVWWVGQILQREPKARVLALAFNRAIAEELSARLPQGATCHTFHGIGMSACRRARRMVEVDDNKMRKTIRFVVEKLLPNKDNLKREAVYQEAKGLMGLVINTRTDPSIVTDLEQMADDYEKPIEHRETAPVLAHSLAITRKAVNHLSYDCMLDHVIYYGYHLPTYDYVVVDEAQDTNLAQILLLERLLKETGRLIAVGDDRQAIYRFRGADSDSMAQLKQRFSIPKTYPLSVTFRCSKEVVKAARVIVPDYEAHHTNCDGEVIYADEDDCLENLRSIKGNAMVLCRRNAPLTRWCLWRLRLGLPSYIRGRDIGKGIAAMVEQHQGGNAQQTAHRVHLWAARRAKQLREKDRLGAAADLMDKSEIVSMIADERPDASTSALIERIKGMFRDTGRGVMFSTVHKAKGLEADHVLILHPELFGRRKPSVEDDNVKYVAITRAKKTLIMQRVPEEE